MQQFEAKVSGVYVYNHDGRPDRKRFEATFTVGDKDLALSHIQNNILPTHLKLEDANYKRWQTCELKSVKAVAKPKYKSNQDISKLSDVELAEWASMFYPQIKSFSYNSRLDLEMKIEKLGPANEADIKKHKPVKGKQKLENEVEILDEL